MTNAKAKISSTVPRKDKVSWNRKRERMNQLMQQLAPIEEKILEITRKEKYPIMDAIEELRATMVSECIHPSEMLVVSSDGSHAVCKFCNRKIRLNNESQT